MCRQLFMESVINQVFRDIEIPCRYSGTCSVKGDYSFISAHEEFCLEKDTFTCPLASRAQCQYRASMNQVLSHLSESKCTNLLTAKALTRNSNSVVQFKGKILDDEEHPTMQFFQKKSSWRPTALYSEETKLIGLPTIYISRHWDRTWSIVLTGQRSQELLNQVICTIEITNDQKKNAPSIMYQRSPISSDKTCAEVFRNGDYLILHDSQVKAMRTQNKLFNYKVTFAFQASFIERAAKLLKNQNIRDPQNGPPVLTNMTQILGPVDFIEDLTNDDDLTDEGLPQLVPYP